MAYYAALLSAAAATVHKTPKSGEGVKSGPIALAIILLLCVAMYFLLKSMSKHLKRVRDDFPSDVSGPNGAATAGTQTQAAVFAPDAILSRTDQDDVTRRETL